jgi:hypothetical protein
VAFPGTGRYGRRAAFMRALDGNLREMEPLPGFLPTEGASTYHRDSGRREAALWCLRKTGAVINQYYHLKAYEFLLSKRREFRCS